VLTFLAQRQAALEMVQEAMDILVNHQPNTLARIERTQSAFRLVVTHEDDAFLSSSADEAENEALGDALIEWEDHHARNDKALAHQTFPLDVWMRLESRAIWEAKAYGLDVLEPLAQRRLAETRAARAGDLPTVTLAPTNRSRSRP
jgi:hypothetical protein